MRFHWFNQRTMPYGSMSIIICTEKDGYMPINAEVIPLAREIFGMPVDDMYKKLTVRLYWHENLRIFEMVTEELVEKEGIFRNKYDYSVYNMMESFREAAEATGWIGTAGNNRIDKIYGFCMVKVVE